MRGIDKFFELYEIELERCAKESHMDYPWFLGNANYPAIPVSVVAARMRKAVERNSHSHSGPAFKATCKRLGIKHTRKAIAEYCASELLPSE